MPEVFVAAGSNSTGPTPQMRRPAFEGEKNAVATMSPNPLMRELAEPAPGCDVSGMMTRKTMFVDGLIANGTTG